MVAACHKVYLGNRLHISEKQLARIRSLISSAGTADIYLLPNLSLAVLKSSTPEPTKGGLASVFLGTFTTKIRDAQLAEQLEFAINESCPRVDLADDIDAEDSQLMIAPKITMKSVVDRDGALASIEQHSTAAGIPFKTVEQRLLREGMTSIDRLLRPLRHTSPHWNKRGFLRNHRRASGVERVHNTCYDYSDVGEAA